MQKRTYKDCPVCKRIDAVGLLTAAQRLYKQYGADGIEVKLKATNYLQKKMLIKKTLCKQIAKQTTLFAPTK